MPRRRRRDFFSCLGLLLVGALLSPACQCGRLELGQANLVVAGRFESLWGFPYGDDQRWVMATALAPDGGAEAQLAVVDVAAKTSCQQAVERPAWFWRMGESLLVFEAIDWDRWLGRISVLTLPCGPKRPLFEQVYLSLYRQPDDAAFYAVVDVDEADVGRLVRVSWPDASATELRARVPTDFLDFDWPAPQLFFRDEGQLVALDLEGRELGRFGERVTYYASSGEGELFFEESHVLWRAKVDGTDLRKLSQNGCAPTFVGERVFYLEPCDGPRQVVMADRATGAVQGRFGGAVSQFRPGSDGWLSWTEGQATDDGPATLWVKEPEREPTLLGTNILPSWQVLERLRRVLYLTPTPGATRKATLHSHDLQTGTAAALAEEVDASFAAAESPWSAHWLVVRGLRETPLGDGGVAPDRTGELVGLHPATGERIPIADGVAPRGFRLSWQAPAVGYLRAWDPARRVGALEVLSMIDRSKHPVDTGVREFEEVFGPRRGVAYVVDEPGREGLYFIEASLDLY